MSCKKLSCCTDFFPPLLYPSDLIRLKNAGKSENEFLKNIRINGNVIKTIKKKDYAAYTMTGLLTAKCFHLMCGGPIMNITG